MRTLFDIIESAKSNQPMTTEEARCALCAMDGLSTFDRMAIRRLAAKDEGAMRVAEGMHTRWHNALSLTPRAYLGETYDPANPDYQSRRKASLKLFEKIAVKEAGEVGHE